MHLARPLAALAGIVAVLAALAGSTDRAAAEKAPMPPAALRDTATHVVVGKVAAIYTRKATDGDWEVTHRVAEVEVQQVEKGEGLAAGGLAYVRYWTRAWLRGRTPPPSTRGHSGLPSEGDVVRIYLAQNAYDGFTNDNKDGGFNVIGANGFEPIERPAGG